MRFGFRLEFQKFVQEIFGQGLGIAHPSYTSSTVCAHGIDTKFDFVC